MYKVAEIVIICPHCNTEIAYGGESNQEIEFDCPICGHKNKVSPIQDNVEEIDFYPLNEPFAYVKILKDTDTLDEYYKIIAPF